MKPIVVLIFACFFLLPSTARALCVGTVISGLAGVSTFNGSGGEYNIYDAATYMQNIDFQVSSVASVGGCRYYMVLSPGSSGNSSARKMILGGDALSYNVFTTPAASTIVRDTGSYNAAGTVSGSFAYILSVVQNRAHSLYWTVTPQQAVKSNASRFQDTLTLTLYAELAAGIFSVTDTKVIVFRTKVENSIDISLVDSGGAFNAADTVQAINFGTLHAGQALSFDTVVRSNSGYVISLQSQNAQRMVHQNYPSVNASVPYSLTLGGLPVNLLSGASVPVASSTGVTPATGTRFPTQFTVGAMSGAEPAGLYQDIITVTVAAF